jgi:hypothetical protein
MLHRGAERLTGAEPQEKTPAYPQKSRIKSHEANMKQCAKVFWFFFSKKNILACLNAANALSDL